MVTFAAGKKYQKHFFVSQNQNMLQINVLRLGKYKTFRDDCSCNNVSLFAGGLKREIFLRTPVCKGNPYQSICDLTPPMRVTAFEV